MFMRKKFKCKSSDETNLSGRCCQLYIKPGALPKLHLWGKLCVKCAPPPPEDRRNARNRFGRAHLSPELRGVNSSRSRRRKKKTFTLKTVLPLKTRAIRNKRKLQGQMENEITLKCARQKTTLPRTD